MNDTNNHLPMIAASGWWEYPQPLNENWEEHARMERLMSYTYVLHNPWYTWVNNQLIFGITPDPHFPLQAWPYGGWSLNQLSPQ